MIEMIHRKPRTEFEQTPAKGPLRRTACTFLVVMALALAPVSAMADRGDLAKEAGIGAGTALATLIYAPVKIAYALGGLIVGGLAWGFSGGDSDVAGVILTPSLRGDYVLSPRQLQGKEEIEFFGLKPEYRTAAAESSYDDADVTTSDPAPGW